MIEQWQITKDWVWSGSSNSPIAFHERKSWMKMLTPGPEKCQYWHIPSQTVWPGWLTQGFLLQLWESAHTMDWNSIRSPSASVASQTGTKQRVSILEIASHCLQPGKGMWRSLVTFPYLFGCHVDTTLINTLICMKVNKSQGYGCTPCQAEGHSPWCEGHHAPLEHLVLLQTTDQPGF